MEWNELTEGKPYLLGFLIIDVVNSSRFSDSKKREVTIFLESFLKEKLGNGQLWDFELDGAKCGFLDCESMVLTAKEILSDIDERMKEDISVDFQVRISLHFGSVIWDENPEKIAGKEFSWICKKERNVGRPDAVVITQDVYELIGNELEKDFYLLGEFEKKKLYCFSRKEIEPMNDFLIKISYELFDKNRSKEEVARAFGISETYLSRLVELAKEKGIVKTKFTIHAPLEYELSERIKDAFEHLNEVKVIGCSDPALLKTELGKRAAEVARTFILPRSTIATSCGTTVYEVAKCLAEDSGGINNLQIYSLLITMVEEMEEVSPAGIVAFLTEVFSDSKGHAAQFPQLKDNLDDAKKIKDIYAKECELILKEASRLDYMITGIGAIGGEGVTPRVTHSFNVLIKRLDLVDTLKDLKAVGECCYQPYTIDGELLMNKDELELLRSNLIYVDLEELRRKVEKKEAHILAVAGGEEKHESVLGGLRARVFNQLVTDVETAQYVIDNL